MKNKYMRFIKRCLLLWLAITTPAWAIFYPPQIVPAQPNSNQFIAFTIQTISCDIFIGSGPNDRELQIIGNRVLVTSLGSSRTDPILCFFPLRTYTFNIGLLPPENYTLEVYRRQSSNPIIVDLVQTANFTVLANTTVAVPSMNNSSLIILALGFLLAGVSVLRSFSKNKDLIL